jgi:HK97 family phage major capsid protein/HK97 family phage prohead protease
MEQKQQPRSAAPTPAPAPAKPVPTAAQRGLVGRHMTRDASQVMPSASKRTADQVNTRLAEMRERKDLRRATEVSSVNREARTAEIAFSSDVEVQRWFGVEILDHSPGAVRMDRLEDGAALLWDHNWSDQRGVVESARIDSDGKGRATVRFSRNPDGEQLLVDVEDKIKRHVSVGYKIDDARLIEVREGDVEVWLITQWTPYEVSFVSVPADITVGVGRSAENPQEEKPNSGTENSKHPNSASRTEPQPKDHSHMKIANVRNAAGHLVRAEVDDEGKIVKELETIERADEAAQAHMTRGSAAERTRTRTLLEMGDRYARAIPDSAARAAKAINEGKSPEDLQRELLDAMNERASKPLSEQSLDTTVGLSDDEVRRFSFLRAVRALAPNASRAEREAAAFEFEVSAAAAKRYGKEAAGICVPLEVLARSHVGQANAERAAMSTTAMPGQALVANTTMWGSFIDLLRNKTTIMRMGTVLGGLVGTIDIPKQTGGTTGYWVGEGEDATETGFTLGQIAMSPKTVAAYSDITRRLMMQSTPDAEGMLRRDLAIGLSQKIDYAGYYGSGSDKQPRGIKNYTGINGVDFAADKQPTFAELVKMETEIASDNADIGQMGYVMNPVVRGWCKTTPKFGTGTESTIWEPGNTVNGYRTEITNQVNSSDVFFGNFADLIIGMWGGLDLTVDPYSLSKSGGLRIVVFQDVDFNLRRVESICWGSSSVA